MCSVVRAALVLAATLSSALSLSACSDDAPVDIDGSVDPADASTDAPDPFDADVVDGRADASPDADPTDPDAGVTDRYQRLSETGLYSNIVTKTLAANPILHFQDGNQPSQVTGYNVYRSSTRSAAYASWPRVAFNYVDTATPNKQWEDTSGAVPPGEIRYYLVTAYNAVCAAEGPF